MKGKLYDVMQFSMKTKTNMYLDNSVYSPSEAVPSNAGKFHVQNTTLKDNLEKNNLNSENR